MGRFLLVALVSGVVFAGCTKRNPAVCCSTAPECEVIGFDEITPCEGLKVCIEGSCESPTCTTSTECSEPAPYCVNMICAATCTADPDCVGVPGLPYCAPDGACVACVESAQCTDPAAAVCDTSNVCRACAEDSECESSVCLALEGVCAAREDTVYVSTSGADVGDCPEAYPCRTVQYGLGFVTAQRRVLRLVDSDFVVPDGVNLNRDVYVDGADTRLARTSSGPIITIDTPAVVVLESIRIELPVAELTIAVGGGADVTINEADVSRGDVEVNASASLRVTRSRFVQADVFCQSRIEVDDCTFEPGARVSGDYCAEAKIHHNRFVIGVGRAIALAHTTARIENNLISIEGNSLSGEIGLSIVASPTGSMIRFNTFVSDLPGTGAALACGANDIASNNLFAWQSPTPIYSAACQTSYSLFDATAGTVPGMQNVTGVAFANIFVAPGTADFHPAVTSGALEGAEASPDVTDDIEHVARPAPTGTMPDIGAYEVP